jgi:hypothetical protein
MTRPRHLHPILDDCVARRAVGGSSLKFEFDISPGAEKTRIAEHAALINIRQAAAHECNLFLRDNVHQLVDKVAPMPKSHFSRKLCYWDFVFGCVACGRFYL